MTDDKALGKSMAKAAAIGAVIAIPVPFVGPIIGAAVGAGYIYFKDKKKADRGSGLGGQSRRHMD